MKCITQVNMYWLTMICDVAATEYDCRRKWSDFL